MRQEQGLNALKKNHIGGVTTTILSELLLNDLENCLCSIFGKTKEEIPVLLAELKIIPESLYYEMFDQRIDFEVSGEIINHQYVPLTYIVQGDNYSFNGRCSTTPKVCGVDLYLSNSYTEQTGDKARQKFSISVKKLVKTLS